MSHRNIFYYDNRDNLTCVRDPDLGLTYFTYDAGNRMTSVKNPFGEVTYYEYSPGGRLQKRTLGNGAVTYYEYDAIGRTSKVDNRRSDMTVISSFEYERDAVGNPVSIQREDGYTVYYEYDAKHQLTAETHVDEGSEIYAWEWDYDAAGNREYEDFNGEVTYYEYNAGNELISETTGGQTTYYEYDRCGNTTAKQEPTGTTYYHWDHENLMTQLDLPDGSHNYFAYDADSKRVQKQDSGGFTEFIYQGPDMLKLQQERDENGDTKAQYTMGNGLEAMRRADGGDITTGDSSFYHFDQLGSTFNLTDENEAITDTYLYNAWGEVLDRTGTTPNPHTYVGKERYYRTADAMLYLLGLRYYAQALGRFVTQDPTGEDINRMGYVACRPTRSVDPTGLPHEGLYPILQPIESDDIVVEWCDQLAEDYVAADPIRENPGILPIRRKPWREEWKLGQEWGAAYLECQAANAIWPGPTPQGSLCECLVSLILRLPSGAAEYVCGFSGAIRPSPEIDWFCVRLSDYLTSREVGGETRHCRPRNWKEIVQPVCPF